MLVAAFVILGTVVLLGSLLAVLHLRMQEIPTATPPPWPLAALHGLLGIGGLGCLALGLLGPPEAPDQGTASFGIIATALIVLAALVGAGFLAAHVVKRPISGLMIGLHATLAVSGFVILTAYVFSG